MQLVSRSGLGVGRIVREQLLRSESRTNHGESLRPIIAAKDPNNLALFVVNRTAGKAVTGVNLDRPIVDTPQAVRAIEGTVADHPVAVRAGNQHELFILIEIQLEGRRDSLFRSAANLQ